MKNEKKIVPLLLRSIYLPIFLFIPQAFAQQQNHSETDFIYREIHTITIDDKGDTTYDATAEVEKVWAYMSERSLDMKYFHETESPLSTIKKLRAELNKSSISSDNIFKEIPEREDVFLSSGKAYTIAIPKTIKRGDVFRCTYSEYYPNVLFAPILTIPTIDSVAEYTVIIKHPKNLHVSWKMYCFRASLLCAVDTSSRKVTILSFKNIPSVRSLEYFPFNAGHAAICFQFTKEGAAQPLDFFSWYAQRTSLEPSIDSARFAHVPLHIGSGMTDEAKLDSIYSYVKKTIRYIADERGENAYIPRKPSEVLDHKYGDCKDRAALVCALAKQAGCKVAMALLSTNPKPPFDVLHPSLFNHVICAFSKQQQMLFFDPTSAYCEFNNLPYKDCETRAYILDAQNPRYENIFRPVQLPSLVLNFHASLDSLDRSVVEITLRNDNAFYARHALHDLTSDQLKLFLQNLINTQLYQIHVGTFQLLSDDGQSLRFQGKADLTKYIIPLGNKYCFPKTVFKVFDNEILERERDRFPIMIAHPVQLELSLALDAPGYSITKEQTFIGQQESQAFATSVLAQAAPIITASYTYTVQPTRYEAAAKAALIAFQREYFKNKKNMFILTKDWCMKQLLLLCLAFGMVGCASSERIVFLDIPVPAVQKPVDVALYETKYGKNDIVYLVMEKHIEHECGSPSILTVLFGMPPTWNYHYIVHRKYVVLNPDIEKYTTFSLHLSKKASVGQLFMQTISPAGTVTAYGKTDLIKENTSDGSVKYKFVYPAVVKGTVIDEGFEVSYNAYTSTPPFEHDIELQLQQPCESLVFSYSYPDWWNINCKRISEEKGVPFYTTRKDSASHKIIMTYKSTDIPAIHDEPYSPYFKEVAQYLQFQLQKASVGRFFYTAPENWQKIADRAKPYLIDRNGFLSSRVSDTTRAITKGMSSAVQKIDTIVSYLQKNIEVVNDGEDRDFADVLKQRKGDRYEITGVAHSMLQKAGFNPEYILIHSASEGFADTAFYSFSQFNIPAIKVQSDSQSYVLFPYRKEIPITLIPEFVQDQPALVIETKGSAYITSLQNHQAATDMIDDQYTITLQEDGPLHVKNIKTMDGSLALFLREKMKEMKKDEVDSYIKKSIIYTDGDVKLTSFSFQHQQDYKSSLVFTVEYDVDNLVSTVANEVLFQTGGLLTPTSIKDKMVDIAERTNPIRIHFNETLKKSVTIQYPQTWELKSELKPMTIENNLGSLHVQYENRNSTLYITENRTLKKYQGKKEEVEALSALTGNKSKQLYRTSFSYGNKNFSKRHI